MKKTSPVKVEAPAIVSSSGIFRYATPDDLKVKGRGQAAAQKRSWRQRLSRALDLKDVRTRPMPFVSPERILERSKANAEMLMAGHADLPRIIDFHDERMERIKSGEDAEEIRELFAGVRSDDKECQKLLAATITATTGHMLMASAGWTGFFQQVNLGDEDQFIHQRRVGSETSVRQVGQDGKAFLTPANQNFSFDPIPLMEITTDIFEYPLFDINQGDPVKDNALNSVSLAADLMAKVDEISASQINITSPDTILTASFTTTGPLEDRSYVAHSRVNVDNLPAGNIMVLTDNSGTSLPRLACLYAIIEYVSSFGTGAFDGEEDLRPEVVHVPASHASALLAEINATSANNEYVNSVIRNGPFRIDYGGQVFTIVPDNTLDPASPYLYVRFNRPVGFFLDKPSQSRTIIDEGPQAQRLNRGTVNQTRAVGFVMPTHWGTNVLAVKYRT